MIKARDLLPIDSIQEVAYLSENSKDIKENTLFFCLTGANFDGHDVVSEVIEKGARVIVHTKEINKVDGITYYQTNDIEKVMASVASKFFNNPSHKLNVIGVTGTNGKTSIAWFLYYLLNKLDSNTGYIGTIDIEYNNQVFKNLFTTPKPIELNYHLKQMSEQGVRNVALEISSHALIMKRVEDLSIKYAIMTNLTFEHINFHGSMEKYQEAKRLLFEKLSVDNFAVLNVDDVTFMDYKNNTKAKVITYGINNSADIKAVNIKLNKNSTMFDLIIANKTYNVCTNLVAKFNIYNILAVISVLYCEGYDLDKVVELLKDIKLPQGRMEKIDFNQDFDVIVDYAHTPDGFEKVFEYAKEVAKKDIIAVFGSAGGDRDKEKRPVLGEIASKYCTKIILTEEDARDEDVLDINKEIKKGITIENVVLENCRKTSVENVIRNAKKDDLILILAKANDLYNVGPNNQVIDYEGDINIVKRILNERGYYCEKE